MKNIFLSISLFFITGIISAQSLSASRLLFYTEIQNTAIITEELKKKGFQRRGVSNSEGFTIYQFIKESSKGTEMIEMGKNEELFMFVYKFDYSAYKIIKAKVLTSDFQYAYTYKNTKYYETSSMRIGVNDFSGILSFFKSLK